MNCLSSLRCEGEVVYTSLKCAGEVVYTYLTAGRQAAYNVATVNSMNQISFYSASLTDVKLGICAQAVALQDILPSQVVGITPRTIYWAAVNEKLFGPNGIRSKLGDLTDAQLKQCSVSKICCAYESMRDDFFYSLSGSPDQRDFLLRLCTEKFPKKVFTVMARGHHLATTCLDQFKTLLNAKSSLPTRLILIGSTVTALYSAKQACNTIVSLPEAESLAQVIGKVTKAAGWTLAATIGTAIAYSTALDTLT